MNVNFENNKNVFVKRKKRRRKIATSTSTTRENKITFWKQFSSETKMRKILKLNIEKLKVEQNYLPNEFEIGNRKKKIAKFANLLWRKRPPSLF